MRRSVIVTGLLVASLAFSFGCKPKQPPQTTPTVTAEPPTPPPPPPPPPTTVTDEKPFAEKPVEQPVEISIDQLNASGVLKTVYFGYDSDEISGEARATLQANADWLKKNSRYNIEIGGHCDERGTIEYNLALGNRRANMVKNYLANLGVSNRLEAVSFGEEKPADPGHGESSYSKNRRADFRIKS